MNIIKNKKYILIVANSNNEGCKLIKQWLISMNQEFISINTDKDTFCISQYHLDSDDFSFMINNTEFHSNQLNKIYFHRDAIKISGLTYFESNHYCQLFLLNYRFYDKLLYFKLSKLVKFESFDNLK